MTGNMQKLSIRLLKEGVEPKDAVREGVNLKSWDRLEGGLIALGTIGGKAPKWSKFLDLADAQKKVLHNNTAYSLVFTQAAARWFVITFGIGHVKIDPAKIEQDFGLRVVLNSVDPNQLKSADVRTPDENTLSRRSQTSRGSDQTAFMIDVERDIVRGLAGTPKDKSFATRLAGTDSLSIDRKMKVSDIPAVCADVYRMYRKEDYKEHFAWIDQIKHVRQQDLIEKLNAEATKALDVALKGNVPEGLHLAYPVIYDPEKTTQLRYKGFRSQQIYPELDLTGYIDALSERGKVGFTLEDFEGHTVHEVDDEGRDVGAKWKVSECLVCEVEVDECTYVLSGGRWFAVDKDLAKEVQSFFDSMLRVKLPDAKSDENEEKYNERLKAEHKEFLCLDRKLITPTGATSAIEVCDFLGPQPYLIHVKDKTSSSRLSHLFNQGTVSGRVLILDAQAREKVRERIASVQREAGQSGFDEIICGASADFKPSDFTVVYAVIGTGVESKLPFFSLVTLRQAARELEALGYKRAFSWIKKPAVKGTKKKLKKKSQEASEDSANNNGLATAEAW